MRSPEELKAGLFSFGAAMAAAIGTEETFVMLAKMEKFAKEMPDVLQEIKQMVVENPTIAESLLTRQGVEEARDMINIVANGKDLF
jgi:predicted ester cyclase